MSADRNAIRLVADARAEERERCAKIIEELGKKRGAMWVEEFVREAAATIRDLNS